MNLLEVAGPALHGQAMYSPWEMYSCIVSIYLSFGPQPPRRV